MDNRSHQDRHTSVHKMPSHIHIHTHIRNCQVSKQAGRIISTFTGAPEADTHSSRGWYVRRPPQIPPIHPSIHPSSQPASQPFRQAGRQAQGERERKRDENTQQPNPTQHTHVPSKLRSMASRAPKKLCKGMSMLSVCCVAGSCVCVCSCFRRPPAYVRFMDQSTGSEPAVCWRYSKHQASTPEPMNTFARHSK